MTDDPHYRLNTTQEYHRQDLESLGWELTVCNALNPDNTPIRRILKVDGSYGCLLYDYLREHIPLAIMDRVCEIGGGYGYLMKDFLGKNPEIRASMLDISPVLLGKQKETLKGCEVDFRLDDALNVPGDYFRPFQLVILNENLGDFPTLVDAGEDIFSDKSRTEKGVARRVCHFFDTYDLEKPAGPFNLNTGAMEMLEKLCSARVPFIFIGEHSCESTVPPDIKPYISLKATGNPGRIALKGHDEYTIKFSYLEKIAARLGYCVKRGPFADYIEPDFNDYLKAVLASRGLYSDSEEIIYQFVGDLYEYEYLILTKE